MKTNSFLFSMAAFAVAASLLAISSCSSDDGGGDNFQNNQEPIPEPAPNPEPVPAPVPSSSSGAPSGNADNPKCGSIEYNPSTQFCSANTIYSKCGGMEYYPSTQFCSGSAVYPKCGGVEYNPSVQFCLNSAVYSKCGSAEYNPSTQFCSANAVYSKCGGMEFSPSIQFCSGTTVYPKCGGKEYSPASQECVGDIVYSSIADSRDNKKYKTVEIGAQTWMAENLNYTPPSGNSKCPDNNASNCIKYGRQYDWATAMALAASYNASVYTASAKHKGVCPAGWHIPSGAEWAVLAAFAGANPGTKLKAKSGWNNGGNGTDDYGFSALPGGYVEYGTIYDSYYQIGDRGLWWTSDEYDGSRAYNKSMTKDGNSIYSTGNADFDYSFIKRNMISVRCIKD